MPLNPKPERHAENLDLKYFKHMPKNFGHGQCLDCSMQKGSGCFVNETNVCLESLNLTI